MHAGTPQGVGVNAAFFCAFFQGGSVVLNNTLPPPLGFHKDILRWPSSLVTAQKRPIAGAISQNYSEGGGVQERTETVRRQPLRAARKGREE